MDAVEFGGLLPITSVMWYFDTHLHYLKQEKSFKPSFVFIDHQSDLVCQLCLWCLLRWLGKTKAQEVHVAQVVNADGDSDSDCDG